MPLWKTSVAPVGSRGAGRVYAGAPPDRHVILTGRDAPQALIDFADLVTEMHEVKDPFQQGIEPQPGIDFRAGA